MSTNGFGIFTWNSMERVSKRYGYFFLSDCNFDQTVTTSPWLADLTALVGTKVRIACRVVESRVSGHLGDNALDIRPSQPKVGEIIELGVGILDFKKASFAAPTLEVGLRPDDDRGDFWIDPHLLYRLHDQTIQLIIEPSDADFTAAPIIDEAFDNVTSNGDGSLQYSRMIPKDTDKIAPRVRKLDGGAFTFDFNYGAGQSVEIVRDPEMVVDTRCPTCGHPVQSIFDHLDIECASDMTDEQIARLLRDEKF